MLTGFEEKIMDSVNEGVIAIDRDGIIKCYNKKAKEIFGIVYKQGIGHEAGFIKDGDIVAIADSSLGADDGDLRDKDLNCLGISTAMPSGSAFAAIGIMGGGIEPAIALMEKSTDPGRLGVKKKISGSEISVEIDFFLQMAVIHVNGQVFACPFIKSIGHIVILDGATGKVKFYQTKGYTARREDIRSILSGKPYMAKGEGVLEMDVIGRNIYEIHPMESNINIIEFLETANGKDISYNNQIKEINGRPTRCSLKPLYEGNIAMGALLMVEDITELKVAMEERDYALASLDAAKKKLHGTGKIPFDEIIGQSESIRTVRQLAQKAAESDSTVLLLGESGTGKGLIAECIHKYGKRKNGPMIYVNCASIPESLMESELFGYEGGAFTGARKEGKLGLFEAAQSGTIFLDEIGDMPGFLQVKLLHVLQDRNFRRVGGTRDIQLDIRIIAATNKDLEAEVEEGSFRKDLFYRISVFPIFIPPLRLRQEDIFPLIHELLPAVYSRVGKGEKRISGEAIRRMIDYSWPGNVRELENVLERAANVAEGSIILKEHLNLKPETKGNSTDYRGETLASVLERAERQAIKEALRMTGGRKKEAMKLLDMGKTMFYEKLKKYGI